MRVRVSAVAMTASLREMVKSSDIMFAWSTVSIYTLVLVTTCTYHRSMLGHSRGGQLPYPAAR